MSRASSNVTASKVEKIILIVMAVVLALSLLVLLVRELNRTKQVPGQNNTESLVVD